MLLYAGTTSISNFNYYILKNKVKMLKQWSKSAGNIVKNNNGTPETLRNKTVINFRTIRLVSVHVPKYLKPLSYDQFGYYLAGLIDSCGNFNEEQELIITLKAIDIPLAYYLKKRIGYGRVKKVPNTNIVLFTLSKKEGIKKVIFWINKKIRTKVKYDQIKYNILNHWNFTEIKEEIEFEINMKKDFKNHWLTGLCDCLGNFYTNPENKDGDILYFQINWNEKDILLLIKDFLGRGTVIYNSTLDLYTYRSNNDIMSLENIIAYFDKFHLLSKNHIVFLKWRKSFLRLYEENYIN